MAVVNQSNSNLRFVFLVLLVCSIPTALGKSGFMHKTHSSSSSSSRSIKHLKFGAMNQELDAVLTEALGLGHGLSKTQQEAKTAQILPMFETMPKNLYGRVGRDAVLYMVQRHFGAEHGWFIRGFDPASTASSASANNNASSSDGSRNSSFLSVKVLKQKLPAYIEAVVEQRLDQKGFALQDVVTMVVVLERMIFDEGMQMLEDAYHLKEHSTDALLSEKELMEVVFTYMLIYGFEADRTNRTDLAVTRDQIRTQYPEGWASGVYGMAVSKAVLEERKTANPFAAVQSPLHSFETARRAVSRATEGYGKWSNGEECQELKGALMDLDRDGTGRVWLTDFYKKGSVGNNWFFEEAPAYLRAQGALDETSASRGSQLIISNYVQSPGNCVEVSAFYSICCSRECDGLVGAIEREIRAPLASPAEILPVVQRLLDAKEEEPWNLTAQLVGQLEQVAEQHAGQVPLHGRLFNQWLHYVFPYECPYPQLRSELVQSEVISEYSNRTGLQSLLNVKQIEKYIAENEIDEEELEQMASAVSQPEVREMSQWTMDEELYVGYHHQGPRMEARGSIGGGVWSMLGDLARLGVLVGGVWWLKQFAGGACRELPLCPRDETLFLRAPGARWVSGKGGGVQVYV